MSHCQSNEYIPTIYDDSCPYPEKYDDSMYATFATPASKKSKKARHATTPETTSVGNKFLVPSAIHIPGTELNLTLNKFEQKMQ